jgi:hypothetical protein
MTHGVLSPRLVLLVGLAASGAWADGGLSLGPAITVDPVPTTSAQVTFDGDACLLDSGVLLTVARSRFDGLDLLRVTPSSPDGGVDPFGRPLLASVDEVVGPRIACAGTSALVVFNRFGELGAVLLDEAAAMVRTTVVATQINPRFAPSVAATAEGFLVTFSDGTNALRARRLDLGARPLDGDGGTVLLPGVTLHALARRGGQWLATTTGTTPGFQLWRVDPSGPTLTAAMLPPFPLRPTRTLSMARLIDGGAFVAWTETTDDGGVVARGVAGSALVTAATLDPQFTPNPKALVDSTGEAFLVAGTGVDVQATAVRDGGARLLSRRDFNHRPLSVDALGGRTAVLSVNNQFINFGWVEDDGGTLEQEGVARAESHQYDHTVTGSLGVARLYFWRLGVGQNRNQTLDEVLLSGSGAVTRGPRALLSYCCASNLGALQRANDVLLTRLRLTPTGYDSEVLSVPATGPVFTFPTPMAGTPNTSSTAVGLGGTPDRVLAGWRNDTSTVLWRLSDAGVDGPAVVIANGPLDPQGTPLAIAAVGPGFWVAWSTRFSGLLRTAFLLDESPLRGGVAPFQAMSTSTPPALASHGDRGLLLWTTGRTLVTALVSPDGGAGPMNAIATTTQAVDGVALVSVDGGYFAAWTSGLVPTSLELLPLDLEGRALGPPQVALRGDLREPRFGAVPEVLLTWRELDGPSLTWRVRVAPVRLASVTPAPDAGPVDDAGVASPDAGLGAGADAGVAAPPEALLVGCGCGAPHVSLIPVGLFWLVCRSVRRRRGACSSPHP